MPDLGWKYVVGDLRQLLHELALLPELILDYVIHIFEGLSKRRYSPHRYMTVSGMYGKFYDWTGSLWLWTRENLDAARTQFNDSCFGLEPWQVAAYTFGLTCFVVWLHTLMSSDQPLRTRVMKWFFSCVRQLPWIKQAVEREIAKSRIQIEHMIHSSDARKEFYIRLPEKGLTKDEMDAELDVYQKMGHVKWKEGRCSGTYYSDVEELSSLMANVYEQFAFSNPLHPDVFPGVRKMEAEVVRMVCNMFHGGRYSCGVVSSGGTESILLACLAYRNRAYAMGIKNPAMLIPVTAHAAFDKAGEFFRIQVTHIPVDEETKEVDVRAMKRAITSDTCMLVGSAPGFPHGTVDPISEVSKLGERYSIPVHVDACLGGFLIAFMDEAGYPLPIFDFRLSGVTSISCDTHKYGFTSKGSSVIVYRETDLLRYQYFCQPNWPGGIYATPTLAGSRAGVNTAICWATMLHYGRKGYVKKTRDIVRTTRHLADGLSRIPGLLIVGRPDVSVIAVTSDVFDIYMFSDQMTARGWNLNPLQFPSAVHMAVTLAHTKEGVAEAFLSDAEDIAQTLVDAPPPKDDKDGSAAIYGMSQRIPDRSLVSEFAFIFLDSCLSTDPPSLPPVKLSTANKG